MKKRGRPRKYTDAEALALFDEWRELKINRGVGMDSFAERWRKVPGRTFRRYVERYRKGELKREPKPS